MLDAREVVSNVIKALKGDKEAARKNGEVLVKATDGELQEVCAMSDGILDMDLLTAVRADLQRFFKKLD